MIKYNKLPANIEDLIPKAVTYLRSRSEILFAYLFGGFGRGNPLPLSDVDIAEHMISDRGYRIPTNYVDTFRVLYERNILNKDLFETMGKMAKFRNIIVHNYDMVDAEIVVGILRKDLDDLLSYKNAIINALETDKTT
jgi:predicted nucleotidyltransferase